MEAVKTGWCVAVDMDVTKTAAGPGGSVGVVEYFDSQDILTSA